MAIVDYSVHVTSNDNDTSRFKKHLCRGEAGALAQFKKTDEGGPSEAKTHYKIVLHYYHRLERNLALREENLKLRDLKLTKLEPAEFGLKEQSLAELNLAEYALPTPEYSA